MMPQQRTDLDFRSCDQWKRWDSNPQPSACKAGALPVELHPHKGLGAPPNLGGRGSNPLGRFGPTHIARSDMEHAGGRGERYGCRAAGDSCEGEGGEHVDNRSIRIR